MAYTLPLVQGLSLKVVQAPQTAQVGHDVQQKVIGLFNSWRMGGAELKHGPSWKCITVFALGLKAPVTAG
jgi:hypothetical protein